MASDQVSLRADGRWGGRLTSRPLPEEDPSLGELTHEERHELGEIWLARAASEQRVAESFEIIHRTLSELDAAPELLNLAHRAVDDEHRHTELCRRVASHFRGSELPAPERLPHVVPEHRGASEHLRRALFVVGQSCMNETLASGFLEATLNAARGPVAKAALRELLSDEVDHARLGWAYLAGTAPALRAEIGPWLAPMAKANLRMWRAAPRSYPESSKLWEQGAPSYEMVESALMTALRDLIVPGLARFELPTDRIEHWLAEGAPTA